MKLLDLFCGQGGAATGYHHAGFTEIVGVDNVPQPRYPFEFVQADALEYLASLTWLELLQYDAIHASPPCQAFSRASRISSPAGHADLIAPTRAALEASGLPWVVENVPEAPLRNPVLLCGSMFDPPLDVKRHRVFEASFHLSQTDWPCRHGLWGRDRFAVRLSKGRTKQARSDRSAVVSIAGSSGNIAGTGGADLWRRVMEMPWATASGVGQAIPPRYTEYVGLHLIPVVLASQQRERAAVNGPPGRKEGGSPGRPLAPTSQVECITEHGVQPYGSGNSRKPVDRVTVRMPAVG